MNRSYTLAELAEKLQLECVGDSRLRIVGLATLTTANEGQLSFLANPRYEKSLAATTAGAVILSKEMAALFKGNALISNNPYLSYAKASQLFSQRGSVVKGIHFSAVVSETATIAASASIGPHCVIGENVIIAADVIIKAGSVVGDHSTIGEGSLLYPNVSVYHGVHIGRHVILHSNAVIGSDGFGFAPSADGWEKIEQLGGVSIGDHVEIGASTSIDRGALDDTVVGAGVIIDNQVQIAHNVIIGEYTAIAGCTGIAGSTTIGRHCTIAGGVGIVGHIQVADKVHITAHTLVTKSITKAGSYSSGTPMLETKQWHKAAVRFSQLNDMSKRLKKLFKKLGFDD